MVVMQLAGMLGNMKERRADNGYGRQNAVFKKTDKIIRHNKKLCINQIGISIYAEPVKLFLLIMCSCGWVRNHR